MTIESGIDLFGNLGLNTRLFPALLGRSAFNRGTVAQTVSLRRFYPNQSIVMKYISHEAHQSRVDLGLTGSVCVPYLNQSIVTLDLSVSRTGAAVTSAALFLLKD